MDNGYQEAKRYVVRVRERLRVAEHGFRHFGGTLSSGCVLGKEPFLQNFMRYQRFFRATGNQDNTGLRDAVRFSYNSYASVLIHDLFYHDRSDSGISVFTANAVADAVKCVHKLDESALLQMLLSAKAHLHVGRGANVEMNYVIGKVAGLDAMAAFERDDQVSVLKSLEKVVSHYERVAHPSVICQIPELRERIQLMRGLYEP